MHPSLRTLAQRFVCDTLAPQADLCPAPYGVSATAIARRLSNLNTYLLPSRTRTLSFAPFWFTTALSADGESEYSSAAIAIVKISRQRRLYYLRFVQHGQRILVKSLDQNRPKQCTAPSPPPRKLTVERSVDPIAAKN
jgi:hypothetical protein